MDGQLLDEALKTVGEVLEARRLTYEIVAVGGSALMLPGLVSRPKRDWRSAELLSSVEQRLSHTGRLDRGPAQG